MENPLQEGQKEGQDDLTGISLMKYGMENTQHKLLLRAIVPQGEDVTVKHRVDLCTLDNRDFEARRARFAAEGRSAMRRTV